MQTTFGVGEWFALLFIVMLTGAYGWGWRKMRRAMPTLATPLRLFVFVVAMVALSLALVWPLPDWSNYLLTMRSIQKVLTCMVAAPLLWLAAPVHMLLWATRGWTGHAFATLHRPGWPKTIVHHLTRPLVAWFLYISAFLFWHDPTLARWLISGQLAHTGAPWLLFIAALLFWWPVVDSGPRFHRNLPPWLLVFSLISVEVGNMVAGITIAFSTDPIYPQYQAIRSQLAPDALPLNLVTDQIAGGAIVWVFGSLVYISSIVFVLLRLFRKEEGSTAPLHLPNWDDHAKFIAPGLEHRAAHNKIRNVDLNHR